MIHECHFATITVTAAWSREPWLAVRPTHGLRTATSPPVVVFAVSMVAKALAILAS